MKRIIFALFLLVMIAGLASAQTASLSLVVANPSFTTPGSVPVYPESPHAFNTTSMSTSTSGSTIVATLTGRKQITIEAASGTGNAVWVAIGTTTPVVSKYLMIDNSAGVKSRTFLVDDSIPVSYISSAAVNVTVLQEGFKNQAKR